MNNFRTRTITGVVFVAVMGIGLVMGGWYLGNLLLLITGGCLWEYGTLIKKKHPGVNSIAITIFGVIVYSLAFCVYKGYLPTVSKRFFQPLYLTLFLIYLFISVYKKSNNGFIDACLSLAGITYILSGATYFLFIILFIFPSATYFAIGYFILIWCNDTFAYLIGRAIGKTKLIPSISPGKTWEGSIGGAVCTLAVAYFLSGFGVTLAQRIVLALVIIVFGTFGDLIESMLKRNIGVKDSGNLLPGHGGMLDRFDSFLFSAPFAYAALLIVDIILKNK